MSVLTTRTFTSVFAVHLRSFEPIGGRRATAVPTVHIELTFKFSNTLFESSHRFVKTSDCFILTLDDRDECFRVMVCQCKDLVTVHTTISSMSVCLSRYMDLAASGVYFLKISGVRSDSKRRDDGRVLTCYKQPSIKSSSR